MSNFEQGVNRWISFIVNRPLVAILASLLISTVFLAGLPYFDLNSSPRDYLGKEMPLVKHLTALEDEYVEDTNILLMIRPKQGDIFNRNVLSVVEELTGAAWKLPYSRRVDSLSNFQYTYAEEDDLIVEDLVTDAAGLTEQDLQHIRNIALSEPALANYLVANDGGATGINILFNIDLGKSEQTDEVYSVLNRIKDEVQSQHPDIEIYETGYLSLSYHWRQGAIEDQEKVVIPAVALIFLGLIYFLGNIRAALAIAITGVLSVVISLGMLGLFRLLLTPSSILSCLMILVLGLADGIHIVKNVRRYLAAGSSTKEAIIEALAVNLTPIFLTSITTAIGFLTFNFTGYAGIRILGNFVAFGVMVAFLLSISLLPAMLCFCNLKPEVQRTENKAYTLLADFVIRFRVLILWLTIPAVLISMYLISFNEFDERITRYLKEGYVFTDHLDIIQEEMTGAAGMIYNFSSGKPGGVSNPEFIRKVDDFARWAESRPKVRHVSTYTDTLKRLNFNMHGDDRNYYRLPESEELAAQYLLLYELSLPYGLGLTNQINLDKSATRVVLTTDDLSLNESKALVAINKQWLAEHAPEFDSFANSSTMSSLMMADESIQINVFSGVVALVIIGVILLFTFRSFNAGLICVICVVSPMLATYGVWGITKGIIDLPTSLTVCMVIGLSVDFSVHFVSKFVYARRKLNRSIEDSVRYSFMVVSGPIATSTVVLGGGFLILSLSQLTFNVVLGEVMAMCILFSAIATFLLVPSILLSGKLKIA